MTEKVVDIEDPLIDYCNYCGEAVANPLFDLACGHSFCERCIDFSGRECFSCRATPNEGQQYGFVDSSLIFFGALGDFVRSLFGRVCTLPLNRLGSKNH